MHKLVEKAGGTALGDFMLGRAAQLLSIVHKVRECPGGQDLPEETKAPFKHIPISLLFPEPTENHSGW